MAERLIGKYYLYQATRSMGFHLAGLRALHPSEPFVHTVRDTKRTVFCTRRVRGSPDWIYWRPIRSTDKSRTLGRLHSPVAGGVRRHTFVSGIRALLGTLGVRAHLCLRKRRCVADESLPICFRLSLSVVHYSGSIEALVVIPFRGTLDDGRTGSHVAFEILLSNAARPDSERFRCPASRQ